MQILDENVPEDQPRVLERWHIRTRQIGRQIGRFSMKDREIVTLLRTMRRTTFFSLDRDFNSPRWCHPSYCIVYLDIDDTQTAAYVRRVLRHPGLNTQAKRMGAVVHASPAGLRVWRRNLAEEWVEWESRSRR